MREGITLSHFILFETQQPVCSCKQIIVKRTILRILTFCDISSDHFMVFGLHSIMPSVDKTIDSANGSLDINEDTSLPVVYVICNGKILDQEGYLVHADSVINQETIEQLENKYLDLISQCM